LDSGEDAERIVTLDAKNAIQGVARCLLVFRFLLSIFLEYFWSLGPEASSIGRRDAEFNEGYYWMRI